MSVVFDIETEPLPDDQLAKVCDPFDPASVPHPGEFDQSSVKLGNLKDASKIAEKTEAARAAHAKAVADYDNTVKAAEAAHWQAIRDKAALSAVTGRVCAIGYLTDTKEVIHTALDYTESDLLLRFWELAARIRTTNRKMIGHNSNAFDVPFVVRRSWVCGVTVPDWVTTPTGYLNPMFVDTIASYQVGNRRDYIKLDTLAKMLGLQGKFDGCTGDQFWKMLRGDGAEREAAIEYLRQDLRVTYEIGRRMRLI